MDVAVRVATFVLVWPFCALVAALVVSVGATYSYQLPRIALLFTLDHEIDHRLDQNMASLTEQGRERYNSIARSLGAQREPEDRHRFELFLESLGGGADKVDLEALQRRQSALALQFQADLVRRSRDIAEPDVLLRRWDRWLLAQSRSCSDSASPGTGTSARGCWSTSWTPACS